MGLDERLDVPDRARRRPRAGRGQPVRSRLPRVRPRALVPGRPPADRPGPRGARALRVLPGHAADGGRLAAPAGAAGRLSAARAARGGRARRRGAARSGAAGKRESPPARCWPRTRSPLERPGSAPPTRRACCSRSSPSSCVARGRPGLGGRQPRRRRAAQAVRARRRAVPRGRARRRARRAADLPAGGGGVRRGRRRRLPAVRRRRPGRALGRHDRLRRRHVPDHRLRPRRDARRRGRRRSGTATTRSRCSHSFCGCR